MLSICTLIIGLLVGLIAGFFIGCIVLTANCANSENYYKAFDEMVDLYKED